MSRPTFSGDTATSTKKPEGSGLANSDVMPLQADTTLELTFDQRATIIQGLFVPTVKRMCTLVSTVIQTGQNADMALWLPLATADAVLRDLKWENASNEAGLRFLELCVHTFRDYADKLNAHMLELAKWEGEGKQGPRPTLAAWQNEDTLRLYDEVEKVRPLKEQPAGLDRSALRDSLLLVIDETGLPGSDLDMARATNEEIAVADTALMAVVNGWTDEQCELAKAWATARYAKNMDPDNNVVTVPVFPDFITPPKAPEAPQS